MIKIVFRITSLLVLSLSCATPLLKNKINESNCGEITSAVLTKDGSEVVYTFSEQEVDTLNEIICSADHMNTNPVTRPAWNSCLQLTFKSGDTYCYLLYDQFIRRKKTDAANSYIFTSNIFWLYEKAEKILGEASKEYQRFPKGL